MNAAKDSYEYRLTQKLDLNGSYVVVFQNICALADAVRVSEDGLIVW